MATLRVGGSFTPTLRVSPGVLRPDDVGRIIGAGFPPNTAVQLTLDTGPPMGSPTTDGAGAFTIALVLFPNDPRIGGKVLLAGDQPGVGVGKAAVNAARAVAGGVIGHVERHLVPVIEVVEVHG